MLLALVSAVFLESESLGTRVSDLRLPFSSPPTTRRVTVEVFDPAATRVRSVCKEDKGTYLLTELNPS
jgi:hypothetical protein